MRESLKSKSLINTPLKKEVLEKLREPKKVNELSKSMNLSRDTIKPHIKYFSEQNLVTRVESGYKLTDLGKIALDKISELESFMELNEQLGDFFVSHDLSAIPQELKRDIHLLKDCRFCLKESPYEIRDEWYKIADKSNWIRCVLPFLYPELLRIYPSLAEGKEFEVITTTAVHEKARSVDAELYKECVGLGEWYLCDGLTEGFWVSDKQLTLFLPQSGGIDLINVLVCNCEAGIEWGSRLFDYYLEKSTRTRVTEL